MFYDTFLSLCSDKKLKPGRVADEIGINRGTVTSWKKNGYTPRAEVLQRIADYFGVTVDYLLGKVNEPFLSLNEKGILQIDEYALAETKKPAPEIGDGLSETEKQIMKCVRQMSPKEQETFLAWLQASQGRG